MQKLSLLLVIAAVAAATAVIVLRQGQSERQIENLRQLIQAQNERLSQLSRPSAPTARGGDSLQVEKTKAFLGEVLKSGKWSTENQIGFRRQIANLPSGDAFTAMQSIVVAINSGKLDVKSDGLF